MAEVARDTPEDRPGAQPADGDVPQHSTGTPLDEPQPSASRREECHERARPATGSPPLPVNRAYVEALLEGVPLPATRKDLQAQARREGGEDAARMLRGLPDRRFTSLDEVGEALAPVQPTWQRARRAPHAESDLPPGGPMYGRSSVPQGADEGQPDSERAADGPR
jgi:hypothetical protein